jgi:hypothetical protein
MSKHLVKIYELDKETNDVVEHAIHTSYFRDLAVCTKLYLPDYSECVLFKLITNNYYQIRTSKNTCKDYVYKYKQ